MLERVQIVTLLCACGSSHDVEGSICPRCGERRRAAPTGKLEDDDSIKAAETWKEGAL